MHSLRLLPAPLWAVLLPAIDGAPYLSVVLVGPELRLAFQSQEAERALGPRRLGAPVEEVFPGNPNYLAALGRCMSDGETVQLRRAPFALTGTAASAERTLVLDAQFFPVRDEAGGVAAVLAQAVDVTGHEDGDERLRTALAINQAGLDLSRSLDVDQVTQAVTRLAASAFAGWGLLDLWQADGSLARVAATHHLPELQGDLDRLKELPRISGRPGREPEAYSTRVARTGQPLVGEVPPALLAAAASPEHRAIMARLEPRWYMCVPVQVGRRRLGALCVVRAEGSKAFSLADRSLLEQFAERAAVALAHASDYNEQRQAALTLQRSLLPPPAVPPGPVQMAPRYEAGGAGTAVGGDWYDTVPLEAGSFAVAVGDVEGHDLEAAALMGQVRAVVHAHARLGLPPGRIAEEANRFVLETGTEQLVTMSYMQIYPREHLMTWVRAGHMPAVVVGPDRRARAICGRGGLPLGVRSGEHWEEETLHLPPGALLAVFTDGLVETAEQAFDEGVAGLAELLSAHAEDDVDLLADLVLSRLPGKGERHDDVALVLLRLPDGGPESPGHVVARRLPAAASSAPVARLFLRDLLVQWELDGTTVETAALLVTELVSNASRHGDGTVELQVSLHDGRLRVAVADDSHRLPYNAAARAEDGTSGWGLQLVEALSYAWGVQTEDHGKAVWFELVAPGTSGSTGPAR